MVIRKWLFWQIIISVFLCQNLSAQSFRLNGEIAGKDTGYVVLSYFRDAVKQRRSDTAVIRQGKFQFNGIVTGACYADLNSMPPNNSDGKGYYVSFFLEPGTINISFKVGEANKAVIKGSKIQKEYEALRKNISKETAELHRLSASYNSVDSLLKNALIDSKTAEEKRKEINKEYNPIIRSKSNKELSYTKKHPNSYVSLLMVYTFVGRLSNDSIDNIYASLSGKIKGSTLDYSFIAYYSRVRKALAAEYPFDKLKINEKAPPFSIYNRLSGDSMTVESFKGKALILESWGLYCVPCILSNPLLENIRKQYSKDGLKIISINSPDNQDIPELISYINKNKFSEWIHVSENADVKQKDNLILRGDFSNYAGLGVPRTVVIDKSGSVIYKNYGYTPEDLTKLKSVIDKAVNEDIKQD